MTLGQFKKWWLDQLTATGMAAQSARASKGKERSDA